MPFAAREHIRHVFDLFLCARRTPSRLAHPPVTTTAREGVRAVAPMLWDPARDPVRGALPPRTHAIGPSGIRRKLGAARAGHDNAMCSETPPGWDQAQPTARL